MNRIVHTFSMLAVTALVSGSLVAPSEARTLMASGSRAVLPSDVGCFFLDASSVTNFCTATKGIETALAVDAGGTYTVTVNAQGASPSNTVGCQAVAVDKAALTIQTSGINRFLSTFGSGQDITLLPVTVPFRGGLFVNCQLSSGGRVNTINW